MSEAQKPRDVDQEERPTEDEIARASLGGVKGSRKLPAAPLTKKAAKQMSPNDEPGHAA